MTQHQEHKYLNLIQEILTDGRIKSDRTGVGTIGIFGSHLKFNIESEFPLLTTKKVYWRGIVEELLWFLRGETDSKLLEKKNVKIWAGNSSREFLDKTGLDYPEGEIGPGYGFQWRHWGADYEGIKRTLKAEHGSEVSFEVKKLQWSPGIDQIKNVIETIKKNPNDRRILVSAWNVPEIKKMALPPCHILFQFYVVDGTLSLQWYQRSVDTFLGLPFNIASYALLTYIIAKVTKLKPGKLIYCGGDTHIYLNHKEQVNVQLNRTPYDWPQLNINANLNSIEDIEKLTFDDFELVNYKSHPAIKGDMAV